jgi:CPA1 family monovalent cation:H+ antiporter
MKELLATEALIVLLLLVAALVAIVVRRLRVPYTVALVVAGLLLSYPQTAPLELSPELILAVLVPPLVFEAAFQIQLQELLDNLVPILLLAIPGVLLTTALVGLLVWAGLSVSLTTGLVLGAVMSATDPVAVTAVFRALQVPRRLAIIVEGESLFNDGTAIVVFQLILAAALRDSGPRPGAPELAGAVVDFLRVSAGGLAIGLALGWVSSQLIAWLDDYLIETTLTTVLAFGSYVLAEQCHVSGVLAVVAAGLINGNVGPRGMSPTTRIVLFNFWELVAFVINSLVFLLIGFQVKVQQLVAYGGPVLIALLAVLVSRAVVVYGLAWLAGRRHELPWSYRHVLFWGGLRGAISLALVLTLPASFPDRELLQVMTLGVVVLTLLGQGTTMTLLIRRLGLIRHEEGEREYERRRGRVMAAQAALQRLRHLNESGLISAGIWERLQPELEEQIRERLEAQRALLQAQPALEAAILHEVRQEGLRAERAALRTLLNEGLLSEEVYEELLSEIDCRLEAAAEDPPATSSPTAG